MTGYSDGLERAVRALWPPSRLEAPLTPCRHCGSGPDPDGDHTCRCPHRDEDCPDHPAAPAPTEGKS